MLPCGFEPEIPGWGIPYQNAIGLFRGHRNGPVAWNELISLRVDWRRSGAKNGEKTHETYLHFVCIMYPHGE